jgi:hypothetical protein
MYFEELTTYWDNMLPVPVRISKVNKSKNRTNKVNGELEELEIRTAHRVEKRRAQ